MSCPLSSIKVDVFDIERVDVAWDVTKERQADVDEEVGAAASDHEDANGGTTSY